MKNKLESARCQINEIDEQMIELFKKRMAAVQMVAEYKSENNLPVFDVEREKSLIQRNLEKLASKELETYYLTFFQGMLEASKNYQRDFIK